MRAWDESCLGAPGAIRSRRLEPITIGTCNRLLGNSPLAGPRPVVHRFQVDSALRHASPAQRPVVFAAPARAPAAIGMGSMARVVRWLLCASWLGLLGCHGDAAPTALVDRPFEVAEPDTQPKLHTGLTGLQQSEESDLEDEEAPSEDPLRVMQQQTVQTLSEWVLSLQSRLVIEFTALDHRQWGELASLLEYIPYSYYLLVIGEYPLLGELQALVLYSDDGGRLPYTNVARFAQPPTPQQLEQLGASINRRANPNLSSLVWVEGRMAATGGPSISRALTGYWRGPIDTEIAMAGDHALIAAVLIDSHFRSEARQRLPTLAQKQPLEAAWLRLQTRLLAVITVADIHPQLRVELRLHPDCPEQVADIAREFLALLHAAREQWSSIDPATYEQTHDTPTEPLLWELVRNLLNEVQVSVEPSDVVVARWTAPAAFRQRLLDEAPETLARLRERAVDRFRRRRMAEVAQALEVYLRHHRNTFPTDIYDNQGRPLFSWRVRLLPYMNVPYAQTAYERLRLDEPWDSPHNTAVLATLPPGIFSAHPDTPAGHADILTLRGPGVGFSTAPGASPITTRDFAVLKQTAVLVEVSPEASLPLGKPGDLDWTADDAPAKLGPADRDHFFAALGSGLVEPQPKVQDRAKLHALFSRQR